MKKLKASYKNIRKALKKKSAKAFSGLAVAAAVGSVAVTPAHAKAKGAAKKSAFRPAAGITAKAHGNTDLPEANFTSKGKKVAPISASESASLGHPTALHMPASELEQQASFQQGVASWYGPGFHNRLTANGERYDMNAMTAAHRTLPFGTKVLVKNPKTGKSVVVRINDRGPYIKGRIIDLSRAAAQKLGISGIQHVVLYRQKSDETPAKVVRAARKAKATKAVKTGKRTNNAKAAAKISS